MKFSRDLKAVAKKYEDKLKKIKVILTDVDGILTDASLYYAGEEVGFNRNFNIYDGYGFRMLEKFNLKTGMISGGDSLGLRMRAENLRVHYKFLGNEDKREAFLSVMADGYEASEIIYLGDELFDIPVLKKAGFSATTEDAFAEVRECADYICERGAGEGCFREVVDLVRYAQGLYPAIPEFE